MFSTLFKKSYEDLNGIDFKRAFESTPKAMLIDVRTPQEFHSGHITGAINMDIMGYDFHSQIAELKNDKTYFIYCRSGNRSGQACSIMADMGLKTFNLSGGIGAWPQN